VDYPLGCDGVADSVTVVLAAITKDIIILSETAPALMDTKSSDHFNSQLLYT